MRVLNISIIVGLIFSSLYILADLLGLLPPPKKNVFSSFGHRSLFVESQESVKADWLDGSRHSFFCTFKSKDKGYCGLDVRVGDGKQEGEDLSKYTHLVFEFNFHGDGEYIRVNFRNAFEDISKAPNGKQLDIKQPISSGVNKLRLPFDEFTAPQYWIVKHPHLPLSDHAQERDNVTHIGFFFEFPNSDGRHVFEIQDFAVVNQWVIIFNAIAYVSFPVLLMLLAVLFIKEKIQVIAGRKALDPKPKGDIRTFYGDFLQNQTSELEIFDPRTGLMTRKVFNLLLDQYQHNYSVTGIALLQISLTEYNQIKAQYGAHIAAEYRSTTSSVVKTCLGTLGIACSWGEEKILVILPRSTASKVKKIADQVYRECANRRISVQSLPAEVVADYTEVSFHEDFDAALKRFENSWSSAA